MTAALLLLHGQLGISRNLTSLHQRFSLLQTEVDVEEYLLALYLRKVVRDGEVPSLLGSHFDISNSTVLSLHAILNEAPCQGIVAQIAEEVLIVYAYFALLGIHHLSPDVLILVGYLIGMRIELTVRTDDTITVEVVVARVVIVVIATIAIFYLAELFIAHLLRILDSHRLQELAVQALVNEIPVETTLEDWILAYQVPVFLQVTARITHGMVVLALDERHRTVRVLRILFTSTYRIVHRAEDIGTLASVSLLILNRTTLVLTLDPLVSLQEVIAHHGLVTHAPCYDRRMIEEHRHIVLVALHNLLGKHRFLGSCIIAIQETVTLLVSLGNHIDTILIAEFVPAWIIRIVAGADCVDIQALHNLDVLNHALHAQYVTSVWVNLMTVGTLDKHRLTIDKELLVLDFHLAETYLDRSHAIRIHSVLLLSTHQGNLQGI